MALLVDPKARWQAMNRLAALFVGYDLTLFGSFVSTKFIHDDHAARFYDLRDADPGLQYDDPTCHPELSGRLLIPGDVDVLCTAVQYKKVMLQLDASAHVRRVRHCDMAYRHWMCKHGEYFLHHNNVILVVDGQYVSTAVDFVVQLKEGRLDLPNSVDADVNGLLYSASGLRAHKSVRYFHPRVSDMTLVSKVLQNVLARKCVVRAAIEPAEDTWSTLPARRVNNLRLKGYDLQFKYTQIHFIHADESDGGDCVICIQPCPGGQCKLALCDCNSRFCVECLTDAVANDCVTKCPMCRTEIDGELAKIDIDAFTQWAAYTPKNVYRKLFKYR